MVELVGGAFGRWLGHTGEALMKGISPHVKEAAEISLNPSAM